MLTSRIGLGSGGGQLFDERLGCTDRSWVRLWVSDELEANGTDCRDRCKPQPRACFVFRRANDHVLSVSSILLLTRFYAETPLQLIDICCYLPSFPSPDKHKSWYIGYDRSPHPIRVLYLIKGQVSSMILNVMAVMVIFDPYSTRRGLILIISQESRYFCNSVNVVDIKNSYSHERNQPRAWVYRPIRIPELGARCDRCSDWGSLKFNCQSNRSRGNSVHLPLPNPKLIEKLPMHRKITSEAASPT